MDYIARHKDMTDEEQYQEVKRMYRVSPDVIMEPEEWKKQRLKVLKSKGLNWSK